MISAFGIEHGVIAKADALGTPESILGMEHMRGEHEGKSFRRCPKCHAGAFGYTRPKAVTAAVDTLKAAR